ncbi:unnamed protein product [Amoebophrya sp. A120]|nr:unnamed protein product [Amoebophrya sp. A120]|eukprot:GSA120T00009003001.1
MIFVPLVGLLNNVSAFPGFPKERSDIVYGLVVSLVFFANDILEWLWITWRFMLFDDEQVEFVAVAPLSRLLRWGALAGGRRDRPSGSRVTGCRCRNFSGKRTGKQRLQHLRRLFLWHDFAVVRTNVESFLLRHGLLHFVRYDDGPVSTLQLEVAAGGDQPIRSDLGPRLRALRLMISVFIWRAG